MLSKLHYNALYRVLGDGLILFELSKQKPVGVIGTFNAFHGFIDGVSSSSVGNVIEHIKNEGVSRVFVDGSNLGGFIAILKRTFPEIEVITFFHNVEVRFFWGAFNATKTLRSLAILIANYLAERKATRFSDKRICLSERDSRNLETIYGKAATHILPMALEDKLLDPTVVTQVYKVEPFALFVGGNFYANREGIAWFARHIAPRINLKVCVVGKGMEDLRGILEISDRIEVIGTVNDLNGWYRRAKFVIAPIFDGSGMKTKIAEALMYGKKVVGTPEAFSGYEDIASIAGWSCRNAEEFVAGMQLAQHSITLAFDPVLRELYERKYSFPAASERLAHILSV